MVAVSGTTWWLWVSFCCVLVSVVRGPAAGPMSDLPEGVPPYTFLNLGHLARWLASLLEQVASSFLTGRSDWLTAEGLRRGREGQAEREEVAQTRCKGGRYQYTLRGSKPHHSNQD